MELKPEKEQKALGQRKQKKQKQQKKKQKKMGQRHLQAGVPLISGLNCCLTTTGTNTWEEVRMGWSEKGAEGNEPGGTAGGQERKRRLGHHASSSTGNVMLATPTPCSVLFQDIVVNFAPSP